MRFCSLYKSFSTRWRDCWILVTENVDEPCCLSVVCKFSKSWIREEFFTYNAGASVVTAVVVLLSMFRWS